MDEAGRRLVVAAVLRRHVAATLGAGPLAADLDPEGLRRAAAALRPADDGLARAHGLTFAPDYPGAALGTAGGARLVLVCRAAHAGEPAALVVTTLLPGRPPQVTAAPPATPWPDRAREDARGGAD